jgi:hypothetical protein
MCCLARRYRNIQMSIGTAVAPDPVVGVSIDDQAVSNADPATVLGKALCTGLRRGTAVEQACPEATLRPRQAGTGGRPADIQALAAARMLPVRPASIKRRRSVV